MVAVLGPPYPLQVLFMFLDRNSWANDKACRTKLAAAVKAGPGVSSSEGGAGPG